MKYIDGDLIDLARNGKFDVIVHGCNCHCQMGAGIAKQIRSECKEAYLADRVTIPGDKSKLGTITVATIEPTSPEHKPFIVVNAYTQYNYTREGVAADYDAIRSAMKLIQIKFHGKSIGLPLIGAGLAGGDWNVIERIICEELAYENVTIVRYLAK